VAVALAVAVGAVAGVVANGAFAAAYPYSVVGCAATNAGMVSVCSALPRAVLPATTPGKLDATAALVNATLRVGCDPRLIGNPPTPR
jgi:hypothetical protein